MKTFDYFIEHPVISWVLNFLVAGIGFLCWQTLPLREYPEVTFPKIHVNTRYPSASPELVESTITNPLEDKLAGIQGLERITSESAYGQSRIHLDFKAGASMDKAMLLIREALSLVELPDDANAPIVQSQGADDGLPFIMMLLELNEGIEGSSKDLAFADLTHYTYLNLTNSFRSIQGVASVEVWGQPYTYKVTLDPLKLYAYGINVNAVYSALEKANATFPAGKFRNEVPVTLPLSLEYAEDFEQIIVGYTPSNDPIFLHQVATIALESDDTRSRLRVNGKPGLCISIQKTSDGNPLEVSNGVREKLAEMTPYLRSDLKLTLFSDQADFVRQSLKNVEQSILEAILFVVVIIFLFLKRLRPTLIPLAAIPLSLLGSCIFLKIFGFSINTLTLLAMVLAIGLVVDDAIVVLENAERRLQEGLSPLEAALQGIREIGFAIIAMTLTLTSVYVPLIFISGTLGELFGEFAVALAGSVLVSGFVALTLSPLLCRYLLKPHPPKATAKTPFWIDFYRKSLRVVLKTPFLSFILLGATGIGIYFSLNQLPKETAPKEDRSLIGIFTPSIPGKSLEATEANMAFVQQKTPNLPEVDQELLVVGNWGGNLILPLKPQGVRDRSAASLVEELRRHTTRLPSIDAHAWSYDSGLPGMDDNSTRGELALSISTTQNYAYLAKVAESLKKKLESSGQFPDINQNLKLDAPGYRIEMDRQKMAKLKLDSQPLAKALQVAFHQDQTLDFTKDGRLYAITLTNQNPAWSLSDVYVVNEAGKKIPASHFAQLVPSAEPSNLLHHNQMRSATLSSDLPEGMTLPQAMKAMEAQVREELPLDCKMEWVGNAKRFAQNQFSGLLLFVLAILFIYAILAMQFESWLDPWIILLTVPLACLGGLWAIQWAGGSFNIYSQIGLITLIGLITKHGILIVEFADQLAKIHPLKDAVIEAATLRLRPILMTAASTIAGALPLIFSGGDGHEAREAMGLVLVGGMLFGTIFTLWILPMALYGIKK